MVSPYVYKYISLIYVIYNIYNLYIYLKGFLAPEVSSKHITNKIVISLALA